MWAHIYIEKTTCRPNNDSDLSVGNIEGQVVDGFKVRLCATFLRLVVVVDCYSLEGWKITIKVAVTDHPSTWIYEDPRWNGGRLGYILTGGNSPVVKSIGLIH